MKKKMTPYILLVPQLILGVVFIIGLGTGIIQSLGVIPAFGLTEPTLKYYKEVLTRPDLLQSLKYSMYIAFMSAFLATVTGTFLCAVLVSAGKVRGIIMRIVQIPIIVPHVVVALFIVNILSQNGILARILANAGLITDQQQFPILIYDRYGFGVILAYLWKEIPFIIYFVLSGFLIIFVFALGAYELPFILGATTPKALPVLAYLEYTKPDLRARPYAMAINGILIVIALIAAVLYYILLRRSTKKLAG